MNSKKAAISLPKMVMTNLVYLKAYRILFIFSILFLLSNLTFDIGLGVIQKYFFTTMEDGSYSDLYRLTSFTTLISIGVIALMALQHYFKLWAQALSERDFEMDAIVKIGKVRYPIFQKYHSADWVSRVIQDVPQANGIGFLIFNELSYQIIVCIVAFLYLQTINIWLALLALGSGPLIFLMGRFADQRVKHISTGIQASDAKIRGVVQEALSQITSIRSFQIEKKYVDQFNDEKKIQNAQIVRRSVYRSTMDEAVGLTQSLITFISAYIIAQGAIVGSLTPGEVMTFLFLMGQIQLPFTNMSHTWGDIQQSLGAGVRVNEMMTFPEENVSEKSKSLSEIASTSFNVVPKGIQFEKKMEAIKFRDVQWKPDGSSDSNSPLFKDFNLTVKSGEMLAIVGPSGVGKSSILKLICGLYYPDAGEVEVFGVNTKFDVNDIRNLVSYVPQSPFLSNTTIRENITNGEEVSEDRIVKAAKDSVAHEFIKNFENGYDTLVGEGGNGLSGGQRQRIAIARAVLKQTPIILLDEPTSAIDNITESDMQETFANLRKERTVVVVAHRMSTIKQASQIVVINHGQIVEVGTHDELLSMNGMYYKLQNSYL